MGQVSRKSDHDPPNVRSRCILTKLYKAKKHLDQGRIQFGEKKKREKSSNCNTILGLNPRMNTQPFLNFIQLNINHYTRSFDRIFIFCLVMSTKKVTLHPISINSLWERIVTGLRYYHQISVSLFAPSQYLFFISLFTYYLKSTYFINLILV